MKSMDSMEKRLDALAGWAKPRTDPPLLAVTPEEVERVAQILNRADLEQEPSPEDLAFLEEMLSRPEVPINHSEPVCFCCGQQPAWERGSPPSEPVCEGCYRSMCGHSYEL